MVFIHPCSCGFSFYSETVAQIGLNTIKSCKIKKLEDKKLKVCSYLTKINVPMKKQRLKQKNAEVVTIVEP